MSFVISAATPGDVEILVHHRRAMFSDMGYSDRAELDAMCAAFRPWLAARMANGEYRAWLGRTPEGRTAGGLGLWLMDWPPHMIGGSARRGNILNVYTEAAFRRQGIARRLMETALEWCRSEGLSVVILHASAEGRVLYESMGFASTNEMRISLAASFLRNSGDGLAKSNISD
jgi:GNAT superfamily N-acetyltransferase